MFTAANIQKNAVKTPQFTKEIAVFLPQIWILHQNIPLMQAFILSLIPQHYSLTLFISA